MKLAIPTALLAATFLASGNPAFAANAAPQTVATTADCDRLMIVLEQQHPANAGVSVDQVRTFKAQNNAQACRDALVRVDPTAANESADHIVVQETAPTVQVQQAAPQVSVQQQQPTVTVHQPTPEIFVRQPAPTVTVNIPQPEITIRMPKPDVNVAMAQPTVQVSQPKPQVQVTQPSQPQVSVQAAKAPQVNVQEAANGQANVQVQDSGKPQVHYESAEPKVVINKDQGQPQVKMEQENAATDQAASTQQQATAAPAVAAPAPANEELTVARIKSMRLYNARGNDLGDIERVIMNQDNKPYIVIGHGGFLGLGEKRVEIPLERTDVQGNRLVIPGMTDDQIRSMPTWNRNAKTYRDLAGNETVPVSKAE